MLYWLDAKVHVVDGTLGMDELALVSEDGRLLYMGKIGHMDFAANWAMAWFNEVTQQDGGPAALHLDYFDTQREVATALITFIGTTDPEFWTGHLSNWTGLVSLFGDSIADLPDGWGRECKSVLHLMMGGQRLDTLPSPGPMHDNALCGAIWLRDVYYWLHERDRC